LVKIEYASVDRSGGSARVVGWCDVFPFKNPRLAHRGGLGMGLLRDYRGRGLGRGLIAATLETATKSGLEKVELTVYSNNLAGQIPKT
jgi:GNAT superfamily N-acetyltransferase